jgi:hypothetical protein
MYNKSAFASFDRSRPGEILAQSNPAMKLPRALTDLYDPSITGLGYILHTVSWVSNVVIVLAVIGTGISADSGHRWAAGNNAYQPIA